MNWKIVLVVLCSYLIYVNASVGSKRFGESHESVKISNSLKEDEEPFFTWRPTEKTTQGTTTDSGTTESTTTLTDTTEDTEVPDSTTTSAGSSSTTSKPSDDAPEEVVLGESGKACILASMDLLFVVPYESLSDENERVNKSAEVRVPDYATTLGVCKGENKEIDGETYKGPILFYTWDWPSSLALRKDDIFLMNIVSIKFKNSDLTGLEEIGSLIKPTYPDIFENPVSSDAIEATFNNVGVTDVDVGKSYHCNEERRVINGGSQLILSNMRIQVGSELDPYQFGESVKCAAHGSVVPIAIGVTVGVVAMVVIGGFLIHWFRLRRRSQESYP